MTTPCIRGCKRLALRRGLCWVCYNDKAVRELYAPRRAGRPRGDHYRPRGPESKAKFIIDRLQDFDAVL